MDLKTYERAASILTEIDGLKATIVHIENGGIICVAYQNYTSDLTNIPEMKYEVIEAIRRRINCLTNEFELL